MYFPPSALRRQNLRTLLIAGLLYFNMLYQYILPTTVDFQILHTCSAKHLAGNGATTDEPPFVEHL
jgi:hypothetical protein